MFLKSILLIIALATIAPQAKAEDPKPVHALLVIGGCCHDYNTQKELIAKGITSRAHVNLDIAYDPDTSTSHLNPVYENENWFEGYDVIIHDECSSNIKDPKVIDRILAPHRAGLPAVLLHCGMHCYRSEGYPEVTPWFEFSGLQSTGHGPLQPIEINYIKSDHPILNGLSDWKTVGEELYNNSAGKLLDTASALAHGKQLVPRKDSDPKLAEAVVVWTNQYGKSRVFATTIGHTNDTVGDARYLDMVARGLLWSVDKLNPEYIKPPK